MNVKKPYRQVLAILFAFLIIGLAVLIVDILNRRPSATMPGPSDRPEESRELPAVPIEKADAVLYFLAPGPRAGEPGILREEPRSVRRGTSPADQVRILLEELAAGSREGNLPVIPPGTSLHQVYLLKEARAVLNYSHALAENCPEGVEGEMALVYSIVNTLTRNIREISAVQILIDGRERETLGGHLDISGFIQADLGVVRTVKPLPDPQRVTSPPPPTSGRPAMP